MKRKNIEDWYRIASDRHGLFRAESEHYEDGRVEIVIRRHPVVKYTACGAWVSRYGHERFVNLRACKQWASATCEEAVEQLKHRKRRQVRILSGHLAMAEAALELLEAGESESNPYLHF